MRTLILLLLSAVAVLCLYDMSKTSIRRPPESTAAKAGDHHEERAYDDEGKGYVVEQRESAADPYVTLQNTDGRIIRAKVLSMAGNAIRIQREDGKIYDFSSNDLTPESKRKALAAVGMAISRTVNIPGTTSPVTITVPLPKQSESKDLAAQEGEGRDVTKIDGPKADIGMMGATYMPGISSLDVVDVLTRRGFTVTREGDDGMMRWDCTLTRGLVDFHVRIVSDAMKMGSVHTLDLAINARSPELLLKEAPEIIDVISGYPLRGTDKSGVVRDWIMRNDGKNATLHVGDLRYEFYSASQSRTLMVTVR